MKPIKQIVIFLGTFMLYHIVFSSFFPVDENNVLVAPDWYTYLGFGIAAIVAVSSGSKKEKKQSRKTSSNPDSLISYMRGSSTESPLEPHANTEIPSVESESESLQIHTQRTPELDLIAIDQMGGHEFEYWCASLLRKIGFVNVSVTQGSGDQGVDVLAEKDGIRYAIQCKCYSSDLSNKPVQEVNAGKTMPQYHCQIGVVMTNRYFTQGAKELADATGTLLWDRDWICYQLNSLNASFSNPSTSPVSGFSSSFLDTVGKSPRQYDPMLIEAINVVLATRQASVSMLQRRLKLGYARAARIVDEMEDLGIVGPFQGAQPRKILITKRQWQSMKINIH